MRRRRRLPVGIAILVWALASAAYAQTPIPLTISGAEAKGSFALPGGITGDLSITFEHAVGLNEDALDASVRLVDPVDPAILARLPSPEVTILPAFPVVVRVEPTQASGLTIAGVVSVSLHTHNLVLTANSPLALYSGPADGPLRDITRSVGIGSYRAGGSGGGFGYSGGVIDTQYCPGGCTSEASEYMIVADARPIEQVIGEKVQGLEISVNGDVARATDEAAALPADSPRHRRALRRLDTFSEVQRLFVQSRTLYATGAVNSAITEVTGLMDYVKTQSGDAISDVWRAHDSRPNVGGQRRAAADTLRFSLVKAVGGSAPPEPGGTTTHSTPPVSPP
jgi:hypothetical protein